MAKRPLRSPHHTVSDAGLLGGRTHLVPGEVSLSLDELPESGDDAEAVGFPDENVLGFGRLR